MNTNLEHWHHNHRMYTIAITGGIGSGKSVISTMLRIMGYRVYDSEAKLLMDSSADIKARIAAEISASAITEDGDIDRMALGQCVFADAKALETLNRIVHTAVRNHFNTWRKGMDIAFIETAIPYQSQIDRMVDEIWEVTAPDAVRISRVMKRNGLTAGQVQARIDAQRYTPASPHPCIYTIVNSMSEPVLPQLIGLLNQLPT